MNIPSQFFKFSPPEFVPITKTPWGGSQIVALKKKYFSNCNHHDAIAIPERIGESIEARLDSFLLKWIDAIEPLSIQIHPDNSNPLLKTGECGKPEAWFVQSLCNPTPLYLGFKEGYSQEEIQRCLQSNEPTDCLHAFIPAQNDYISVPIGCIHALGAGILIAEPQRVVPNKEGKTWRIFDWNRCYNVQGERDEAGVPRELHIQQAMTAIDWSLPRGSSLEKLLVKNLKHGDRFLGDAYNPFCVELFLKEEITTVKPLVQNQFSVITVFEGEVKVSDDHNSMQLIGGETGFIPTSHASYQIDIRAKFQKRPCVLIFAMRND